MQTDVSADVCLFLRTDKHRYELVGENMAKRERCSDCMRPICQRQLTLDSCKYRNAQDISEETIKQFSVTPFEMHNLFLG